MGPWPDLGIDIRYDAIKSNDKHVPFDAMRTPISPSNPQFYEPSGTLIEEKGGAWLCAYSRPLEKLFSR